MVRFDKPCKQVGAAVKYFRAHMAKKDYLSQGGQVELTWVGEGAKQRMRTRDHVAKCVPPQAPKVKRQLRIAPASHSL
jgi:hypothetical protein